MSEFINTADVIGDDEMCDQIIMRTVTEYKENRITTVGQYAFLGCKELAEVDLPEVTTVGQSAFSGCTALATANMPKATSIGNSALNGCTSLTSLYFPAVTFIGSGACLGCTSLKSVRFPAATITGYEAFKGVASLTDVDFPNATSISAGSLRQTSISKIDLPKAKSIENNAFTWCNKLKTLILRNDAVCTLASVSNFENTLIASGTGYIYVPRALLSDTDETKDYRRATNWSTFAAQFRDLESYTVDGTVAGELDETKIAA